MLNFLFFYRRKHPFFVPLLTLVILFLVTCFGLLAFSGETIGAPDARVVKLTVDGEVRTVPTRAETVKDFLARAGVELKPEDVVEPMLNSPINGEDFSVNVYRARLVTIVDKDGRTITAKIAESTPAALAKKAGFKLFPEDLVVPEPPDQALEDGVIGEKLVVQRATVAIINLYGNNFPIRTQARTVGELLDEKDIKLIDGDSVQPNLDTPIKPNIQVFILGHGKQLITVSEEVEQPIERREDATMEIGHTRVLEEGSPGKRVVTYEVTMLDGQESNRREIQSFVAEPPQKKIMIVGAKKNVFSGGFEAALATLRSCESGGNYANKSNPRYRGAYQFAYSTWNNYGGYYDPADAPPFVQDQKTQLTYQARGWQPWPHCSQSRGLQDIYR